MVTMAQGTWGGGGANWSTTKLPDSLPANQYHILQNIQCPGRELNPHPPTLVISSTGQERAPCLTHWATGRSKKCFYKSAIKLLGPRSSWMRSGFTHMWYAERYVKRLTVTPCSEKLVTTHAQHIATHPRRSRPLLSLVTIHNNNKILYSTAVTGVQTHIK